MQWRLLFLLLQQQLILDAILLQGQDSFSEALDLVLVDDVVRLELGQFLLEGLWERGHFVKGY